MPVSVPLPGGGEVAEPSSAGEALRMAAAGLGWLATADAASLPAPVQAGALRDLERLQSFHTAAAGAGCWRGSRGSGGSRMTGRGRRGRG